MSNERWLATVAVAVPLLLTGCLVKTERTVTSDNPPLVQQHDVIVEERSPMPAPRVEVRPMPPAPTYHWVEGHYEWSGSTWNWVPGYWAQ